MLGFRGQRPLHVVIADICDNCGEVFHREEIMRALLSQAETALKQGVELDIRRFAQAA